MNNENWGCMKCGNTNDTDNIFCEYCGGARPVDPVAVLKEKAKGFMKQVGEQVVTAVKKKRCFKCGTYCNADELFCFSCGTRLDEDDSVPMQEIQPLAEPVSQKVVCLNCGWVNPDMNRFCDNCGEVIRKEENVPTVAKTITPAQSGCCPDCGAKQLPDSMFCDECGAKLVRENGYSQ